MNDAIDVHGHGVPARVVHEARRNGAAYGGIEVAGDNDRPVFTFPGAKPLRPLIPGMDGQSDRIEWLDRNGIAAQLVAPWLDVTGAGLDRGPGSRWVSFLNEAMAEWCRESDRRLFPLASLHLADAGTAAAELARSARDLGCVGAMIPTHHRYGSVGVDGWEPFWEVAEEEQLPIILHPPVMGPTVLADSEVTLGFRSLWGRPMDTTILAEELLLHRLFERYPRIRVILVHGGGYLPYQAGRIDGEVATGRVTSTLNSGPPSAQVGNFYFDTTLMLRPAIEFLVSSYGPEHVLVGSDYPFFAKLAPPCAQLSATALDERAKALVRRDAAAALFPKLAAVGR